MPRSDVYSLGSVLYEMLTGNAPFTGANAQQIIMKIITEPAEVVTKYRKAVPTNVAAAVARSLEKLPADRFETARAFADALHDARFTCPARSAGRVSRPTESGSRTNRETAGAARFTFATGPSSPRAMWSRRTTAWSLHGRPMGVRSSIVEAGA